MNKRTKLITVLVLIIIICFSPLIVTLLISLQNIMGITTLGENNSLTGFYGSVLGGLITLIGVIITIKYTDYIRKLDQDNRYKERQEDLDGRAEEFRNTLSIQYKPILELSLDSTYEHLQWTTQIIRNKYRIDNIISLCDEKNFDKQTKRIAISLNLLNIGRGEAKDLIIESCIFGINGEIWHTVTREYTGIVMNKGINLVIFKAIGDEEWDKYKKRPLAESVMASISISYKDLVNVEHNVKCCIIISGFMHLKEQENVIQNVLVANPYDSIIHNKITE